MALFSTQASAATNVWYSVGQNTTDHKTGSPTVTIDAAGVATFSVAQTATNMGVGDAVTYGGVTSYISAKQSTSIWNLITATGAIPTATTSAPVTSIAHAFSSLNAAVGGATPGAANATHMATSSLLAAPNGGDFILNIPAYYDSGADTTAVNISGFTTGADNYIRIYTPTSTVTEVNQNQRHSGNWNEMSYQIKKTVTVNSTYLLQIKENYVRVDGLQLYNIQGSYTDGIVISISSIDTGGSDIRIQNSIIKATGFSGSGAATGIDVSDVDATVYIWNNILYNFVNGTTLMYALRLQNGTAYYVYNNTIINSYRGIYENVGSLTAINNIVKGSGDTNAYVGTFTNSDYNSTDGTDTTGQGTHSKTSQTFSFVSEATENFHLLSTDTGAKDSGEDLSATTTIAFNTDIDGQTRTAPWDIGADEYIADTTPPVISSVASSTTATTATITWTTDESATSTVNYGLTSSYGSASTSTSFVTSHSVVLTGLSSNTTYHFQVASTDASGNTATSSDYTLVTQSIPAISSVSGTFNDGSSVTVSGSQFGTKSSANPAYWNMFDSEINGNIPSGLTKGTGTLGGIVASGLGHSQSKSMLFSFNTSGEQFERNIFDFGAGVDKAYISAWIYIDKTGSTATDYWQWKGIYLSSESHGYTSSDSDADAATSNSWWYVPATEHWGNNSFFLYYNGVANNTTVAALPNDAYLWGEWQRIEIQLGASSVANATDATYYANRIGRAGGALANGTGISHGTGDRPWRYVALGQGVASVVGGTAVMKIYYDDLYIDSTWQRVELGDTSTFSTNTHREVQTPTAWADGSITFTLNQGSFTAGETVYLFVVDSNGNANTAGYPVFLGNTTAISNPYPSSIASTTATIVWTTNNIGSSIIDLGFVNNSYSYSTPEADTSPRVASHSVTLNGLVPCTVYHYRTKSTDASSNTATSTDSMFATPGCTGSSPVTASTTVAIATATGGSVSMLTNGIGPALTVPASFAGSDANFQIKTLDKTTVINSISVPSGFSTIGSHIYDFKALSATSTAVSSFNQPITVSITYQASDVSGMDESTLKIYRYDGSSWNQLSNCSVNTSTKIVSCTTTSFSTFGLFGQASASSGGGPGFPPLPSPPSPVTNLTASASDGKISLSWTNPNGANSNVIVYHNRGSPMLYRDYQNQIYSGTNSSYIDTNLTNGETYYYSVYVSDYYSQLSQAATVSAVPNQTNTQTATQSSTSYPVSSQTTENLTALESIQAEIASLISEIANLPKNPPVSDLNSIQNKLLDIISELKSIQGSQVSVSSTHVFTSGLYYGLKSNDVIKLQEILKQDPSVYPEGIVNGKFGPITLKAVKRFQLKYNITTQDNPAYGYVGPKTREKLNEMWLLSGM